MSGAAEATRRRAVATIAMALSGAAGLGYQMAWTQRGALWLGHEVAAVLAIVTAFFTGLALGAWWFGPAIERSARPLRWYVGCELVIAGWGALLAFAMAPATDALLVVTGAEPSPWRQWSIAFAGTTLLLLPATTAMGATLPAIERLVDGLREGQRSIAGLYAANTAGAVAGIAIATIWLMPSFGATATIAVCIAANLCCAALAAQGLRPRLALDRRVRTGTGRFDRRPLVALAVSGFLGIGYEVLVVRVLSQVTEDTVYTFATLLAVYLAGHALGAAAWQWGSRDRASAASSATTDAGPWLAVALACLFGIAAAYASHAIVDAWSRIATASLASALSLEAVLAVSTFAPATFAMGMLFSSLCARAVRGGAAFGTAMAANLAGGAVAPIVLGAVAAPMIGAKGTLAAVVVGYAAMASWSRPRAMSAKTATVAGSAVTIAVAVAVVAPPLVFVSAPVGGRVVELREGPTAAVSVIEDADGVRRLHIDDRAQEGSSATRVVDGRQGLIPVLLHRSPSSALFLGLGTGVTATTAAQERAVAVDAVELLPDVVRAASWFRDASEIDRVRTVVADARRYVRATTRRYDVVVADNFHPARSGAGALYTVEHFRAVRDVLSDDGLFCQWLPLHQLDLDTLRSIVRSFVEVFPDANALLANNGLDTPVVGLVGRRGAPRVATSDVRERLARASASVDLDAYGLADELALLGTFVAGPAALERFAHGATANTDDRPIVAYRAPFATYAPASSPRERLLALLAAWSIDPDDVLIVAAEDHDVDSDADRARLAAYWTARDRFIAIGARVAPTTDVRAMLAQVRDPLLDVLHTSPDFRPAYDPLLRMAGALAALDASSARSLFVDLSRAQPMRPEAARFVDRLDHPSPTNSHDRAR